MQLVFLSYAREDKDVAGHLARRLQDAGHSVWWDQHINLGKTWDEEIGTHLAAATCVIVIWSKSSIGSKWVRSEAHLADQRGVLLPIIIQGATPPPPFNLTQSSELTGWNGDDDVRIDELLSQVAKFSATSKPEDATEVSVEVPRPSKKWLIAGVTMAGVFLTIVVVAYLVWLRPRPGDAIEIARLSNTMVESLSKFKVNRPTDGSAERRKIEEIKAEYSQALAKFPNSSQLHKLESDRIHVTDGIEEAIKYCLSAIARVPNDSLLYGQLGYLYYLNKQDERATAAFNKSIDLNTDRSVVATAYLNLAEIYADQNKVEDAMRAFRAALNSNRNRAEICRRIISRISTDMAFSDLQAEVEACS